MGAQSGAAASGAILIVVLVVLAGPLVTLAIWLWLRSRREPVDLYEPLDMGRVFAHSFAAFRPEGWPVLGLAAVLVGVPQAFSVFVTHPMMVARAQAIPTIGGRPDPLVMVKAMASPPILIAMLIGLVLLSAFYVAAFLFLGRRFEGAPIAMGRALAAMPARLIPAFAAALLAYLGVLGGSLLFLLPGVVLALSWTVVVPVMVCEDAGMLVSFRRSRWLATGSRGRILVLGLLLFALMALVMAPAGIFAATTAQPGAVAGPLMSGWRVVSGIALAAVQAGYFAGLYVELRRIRDGRSLPGLAELFA